jgi:hypothetical protein
VIPNTDEVKERKMGTKMSLQKNADRRKLTAEVRKMIEEICGDR